MKAKILLSVILLNAITLNISAQQPKYTRKHFVSRDDPKEFVRIVPDSNGFMRTYLLFSADIRDVDDDNSTYISFGEEALVCIEGEYKNRKREGVYSAYLIDSLDHQKRYKIWEQTYANDKLNGQWRVYSLKGNLVSFQTFENDSLKGLARDFWIDGKSIMNERVYVNGRSKYVLRDFYKTGRVSQETTMVNDVPNGPAKKFYPDGTLQDEVVLTAGLPNGARTFYYPSGKIWIEQQMKNGKPWTVIANYAESGQKRNAGTLKDGNGTLILYDEDGSVRETRTYKNGEQVNQ